MSELPPVNRRAAALLQAAAADSSSLRIALTEIGGAAVFDFGVESPGGLLAGVRLAEICMGNLADIRLAQNPLAIPHHGVAVEVTTDWPALACIGCQYAGWPVQAKSYFAMGSGPMRLNRGREPVLETHFSPFKEPTAVGVLEAAELPSAELIKQMAAECGVEPGGLKLAVAPTTSLAGMIQIVARSVEATLHKLHELNYEIQRVQSAWGTAPLPIPASDTVTAIGRTNDAILYGARVQLWIDDSLSALERLAGQLPSSASKDFGRPFKTIFESYDRDFYAIDKQLFSAAEITLISQLDGSGMTCGELRPDLIARSNGE